MNKSKTIGIIGGQGPLSTADFYMRIIHYYQDHLGAKTLEDYPPMIIFSVPSPDLISGVENEELTFNLVLDAMKKLERDGCDFIVIACNSLHFLIDKFRAQINIPILNIAEVVTEELQKEDHKTVGILATYTTINKRIYDTPLSKIGINSVVPDKDDQDLVEQIILNENKGKISYENKSEIIKIMEKLQQKSAETVLLACTELPILITQADTSIPIVNCNQIFAEATAKLASGAIAN